MNVRKKITLEEGIFISLSILHILVKYCFGIGYLVYLVFAYLLVLILDDRLSNGCFMIYSLFVPDKYLQLLSIPIFLFKNGTLFRSTLKKEMAIFLTYITTIGIINCIVYHGAFAATLFQVSFFYCVLMIICSIKEKFVAESVFAAFDKMFFLQCVTIFLQLLITKHIMDSLTGTLISAHYLGVFLIVYSFALSKLKIEGMSRSGRVIRLLLSIAILIAADAKHVWMSFILAVLAVRIQDLFKVKDRVTFVVVSMIGLIIAGSVVVRIPLVRGLLRGYDLSTYLYNVNYNKKYQLFLNTLNKMMSWNGIFGFGVGQYGSQISITMSKGIIYSWRNDLQDYCFAIQPYKDAISGLMTEWYTLHGIPQSSMVLGYPLVSFVGLVAELGIVGSMMLLKILDKGSRSCEPVFLIWFFILAIFDTYLEIPCVFVLILIASFVNKDKGRPGYMDSRRSDMKGNDEIWVKQY